MDEYYRMTNSKCPMCNSYWEDCAGEELRGGFRLEVCTDCGYIFNVE